MHFGKLTRIGSKRLGQFLKRIAKLLHMKIDELPTKLPRFRLDIEFLWLACPISIHTHLLVQAG